MTPKEADGTVELGHRKAQEAGKKSVEHKTMNPLAKQTIIPET